MQLKFKDNRVLIPKIEFYITNVCNLACPSCNRFNDFDFKGWQNWDDYADAYKQWADKVTFDQIVILGGEPLLNPSLVKWVLGINSYWNIGVQILTNGTRINAVKGLYDLLVREGSSIPEIKKLNESTNYTQRNWMGISLHDINYYEELDAEIRKFLRGNIELLVGRSSSQFNADYVYIDENKVKIPIWIQNEFSSSSIIKTPTGYTLHNNDPLDVHGRCGFAIHKNYHFIRGALYKCGPAALMPEFDLQHHLEISDSDRELLHSYAPLTVDQFNQRGHKFLETIDDVLPQCKFCPVSNDAFIIRPVLKSQRHK